MEQLLRITYRLRRSSPLSFLIIWLIATPSPVVSAAWDNGPSDEAGDRMFHATYFSELAGENVGFNIRLPIEYDTSDNRFPVIYHLHGAAGSENEQVKDLEDLIEYFKTQGQWMPVIYVLPNGLPETMWADSQDGTTPVARTFIEELIPNIDATYRTIASSDARAIQGASMGGYGAATFAFKNLGLFSSLLSFSGAFHDDIFFPEHFGNDVDYYELYDPFNWAAQERDAIVATLAIYQIYFSSDVTDELNVDFDNHLNALKIPHDLVILDGRGHGLPEESTSGHPESLSAYLWQLSHMSFGSTIGTTPPALRSNLTANE